MNAAKLIRDQRKLRAYWLGCVDLAVAEGDGRGEAQAREQAEFCRIRIELAQAVRS